VSDVYIDDGRGLDFFVSTLKPIQKFGIFSAAGTLLTLVLLFAYVPAALQLWPPGFEKHKRGTSRLKGPGSFYERVNQFWYGLADFLVRHNRAVIASFSIALVVFGIALFKLQTSVKLIKMFDSKSKILRDYGWMEENLGELVPMEVVLRADKSYLQKPDSTGNQDDVESQIDQEFQLSLLERLELSSRVRKELESSFGDSGSDVIGNGFSTDIFVNESKTQLDDPIRPVRAIQSRKLEESYDQLSKLGYLRKEDVTGNELWRVSLRLAALNDVDYGEFVSDLKTVVEPILSAYEYRNQLFREIKHHFPERSGVDSRLLVLGWKDTSTSNSEINQTGTNEESNIDQTGIFCRTLADLLANRGFTTNAKSSRLYVPIDPDNAKTMKRLVEANDWQATLMESGNYDCVVIVRDAPAYNTQFFIDAMKKQNKPVVDMRNHRFEFDRNDSSVLPIASERKKAGDTDVAITADYTGIVPIVYKSQRALLNSLINSLAMSFVSILAVMMLLLRDWKRPFSLRNSFNLMGGLVAMIPNTFPIILVFGAMALTGFAVDIGSMMTASVALGIAVDDTIHYLTWFREGMHHGLNRLDAIKEAYRRCASSMLQTSIIGGFGLSVFAFSTFTPTQRFGVLMLVLLAAAVIGDLILLPALLASPLGKFLEVKKIADKDRHKLNPEFAGAGVSSAANATIDDDAVVEDDDAEIPGQGNRGQTAHSRKKPKANRANTRAQQD
jgi:uncharacterized protein